MRFITSPDCGLFSEFFAKYFSGPVKESIYTLGIVQKMSAAETRTDEGITPHYSHPTFRYQADVSKSRDEIIDLVRSICALLVLAGHARNFVMFDFDAVSSHSLITKVLYLLTSLHHEAVVVFVLLSGYFIGGSVIGSSRAKKFAWGSYAIDRLSRLWIVLLPALLLTLAFDAIGSVINGPAYHGAYRSLFNMGPTPDAPVNHGILTFFGNLFSLQTILVPTYGSNGPLWSLSCLFWYDVLFPSLICGVLNPALGKLARTAFAILFACIVLFLPQAILLKGFIWLVGVVVWFAAQYSPPKWTGSLGWKIGGGLLFGSVVLASKIGFQIPSLVVALAFGLWMPSLLGGWRVYGWWSRLSKWLSEMSFSLYVVHFPLMFLISCCLIQGHLFEPSVKGLLWILSLCGSSLVVARIFWSIFESRTGKLRKFAKSILLPSPASPSKPSH